MSSRFYTTLYLLLLIALGYFATDIYLPSLPALAVYFNTTDNLVQMTLFSYLVSFGVSPIIFGPLSDHIGRKKVILGGIIVCLFATLGAVFVESIQWLIFARLFQGIGAGAVLISARASVADLFTGPALARQMSFMTMLMPLILALAPSIGGYLQEQYHWHAVFIFLSLYLSIALVLALFREEPLKKLSDKKISQVFSTYRAHLQNYVYLAYGLYFILPSIGLFAYLTVSPFLFQNMIGLSPSEYGFLAIYVGATILISGFINLQLLKHFSLVQVLTLGSSMVTLSGGLLLIFYLLNIFTKWSLLGPALIFFTCLPFCIANSASKAYQFVKSYFGAATALLTTLQFLVGSLGSLIFSLIPNETPLSLAICFIFIGLASLFCLGFANRLEMKSTPPLNNQ